MKKRKLGNIEVSAIGMGCMGFTHAYGKGPDEKDAIRLVHEAFDLGCTFFDTAEMYSYFKNEEFVGKALKELPRDKVVISDKFWPTPLPGTENEFADGKLTEAGIRITLEGALRRLQTDYIDIYTQHLMVDGNEEEVAGIMGKLIAEGKIRGWGQSSPTPDQIRKAHAITPLTAVQSEYSMMERRWEKDVIPLTKELGIGFVAFSPMGNGFLSGKYNASSKFTGDDVRRVITRFSKENMEANAPLLAMISAMASEKGCSDAQIALAWILKGGENIVPIPGMRSSERISENLGAAEVVLSDKEYDALNEELSKIKIHGSRDGKDIQKLGSVPDNATV